MNYKDHLYSFVYRGVLAEEALDKAGRKGKENFALADNIELSSRLGLSLIDEELVVGARKMAVVYAAICAFENSVRAFVTKKLLEVHGENWWEVGVSEKIRKFAETRKETESNIKWHTPRGDALINYTEFGDLISIISSNWNHFEPHIVEIEWAKQIVQSLERSRNVIMHSGELASPDIERVGMNIRDWTRQVG